MGKRWGALAAFLAVLAVFGCGRWSDQSKTRETDRGYYDRAEGLLRRAESKPAVQAAREAFAQFPALFPHSSLLAQSRRDILRAQRKLMSLKRAEEGTARFDAAMAERDFGKAAVELEAIKPLISDEAYRDLKVRLEEGKKSRSKTGLLNMLFVLRHSIGPNP